MSRCQPWHRQHSPHGHRCHGCRPCQRSHWSLSPCHKLKSLHKCLCIFCKGQDYNLDAKTFNSVNIFMVSKSSIAAGPAFFYRLSVLAFSEFSLAFINTIRVFLSRRGLTGLRSPGPVWPLWCCSEERVRASGDNTASRARTLATWTPQVIKSGPQTFTADTKLTIAFHDNFAIWISWALSTQRGSKCQWSLQFGPALKVI